MSKIMCNMIRKEGVKKTSRKTPAGQIHPPESLALVIDWRLSLVLIERKDSLL